MKKTFSYNTEAIKALSEEFGVSRSFVRLCIRKEKHSLTAQTIAKKYNEIANPSLKAIEAFRKKPFKF